MPGGTRRPVGTVTWNTLRFTLPLSSIRLTPVTSWPVSAVTMFCTLQMSTSSCLAQALNQPLRNLRLLLLRGGRRQAGGQQARHTGSHDRKTVSVGFQARHLVQFLSTDPGAATCRSCCRYLLPK